MSEPSSASIDGLIAEAIADGFMLTNLFQISDLEKTWQAAFRKSGSLDASYGYGKTAPQALWRALEKAREMERKPTTVRASPEAIAAGLFD